MPEDCKDNGLLLLLSVMMDWDSNKKKPQILYGLLGLPYVQCFGKNSHTILHKDFLFLFIQKHITTT